MFWTVHASCVHVNSSPLLIFLWISEITLDLYESNANTADCITVLQLGTVMDKLLHYILPDTSTKSKSRTRSDISDGKLDVDSPTSICVWSVFCVIFAFVCIDHPHVNLQEHKNVTPLFYFCKDCKDFLSGSLNQIHKDRLTLEELKNHPWPNWRLYSDKYRVMEQKLQQRSIY